MKSWEARSGRSVLIFSEEFDFQGPGVQKDPKLEIRKIAGVPNKCQKWKSEMAGQPGNSWFSGRKVDQMAREGLRSGRSLL